MDNETRIMDNYVLDGIDAVTDKDCLELITGKKIKEKLINLNQVLYSPEDIEVKLFKDIFKKYEAQRQNIK